MVTNNIHTCQSVFSHPFISRAISLPPPPLIVDEVEFSFLGVYWLNSHYTRLPITIHLPKWRSLHTCQSDSFTYPSSGLFLLIVEVEQFLGNLSADSHYTYYLPITLSHHPSPSGGVYQPTHTCQSDSVTVHLLGCFSNC